MKQTFNLNLDKNVTRVTMEMPWRWLKKNTEKHKIEKWESKWVSEWVQEEKNDPQYG